MFCNCDKRKSLAVNSKTDDKIAKQTKKQAE